EAASRLAEEQRDVAVGAQATAQTEAEIRATAQAEALSQADRSKSRELVAAAEHVQTFDPELSILLALESIKILPSGAADAILHVNLYDLLRRELVAQHTDT